MAALLVGRWGPPNSLLAPCPWCDVIGASSPRGLYASRDALWLLASCTEPMCERGVLISVPRGDQSWARLDTGDGGMFLDRTCLHPTEAPAYQVEGVPPEIARGMQEALRCRAAGLLVASTLAARYTLVRATERFGGRGRSPLAAVRSLPADVLDVALQRYAEHVLLLHNAEPTGITASPGELDRLLTFAEEVLHNLYVVPARLGRS